MIKGTSESHDTNNNGSAVLCSNAAGMMVNFVCVAGIRARGIHDFFAVAKI